MRRSSKDLGKRLLRQLFELGQKARVNLLPSHFYSEIPDIAELRRTQNWRRPHSMIGLQGAALGEQLAFAESCCTPQLVSKIQDGHLYKEACRANGAPGYGRIEADFLYCFIASKRPRKVVQVGCGVSTAIMLRSAREHGIVLEMVCIDPFPTRLLVDAADRGEVLLLADRAQDVPEETLTDLAAGDLLFVDSTHTVKPGSEVNRLILDVLPRLAKGAYVHFHDIWFPYDYAWSILEDDLFFWNESPLLHAFLAHNDRFALRLAMSMVHDAAPARLQQLLPSYRPARCKDGLRTSRDSDGDTPSAAYLEVVAA